MNKKRILELIDILKRQTDMDHARSLKQLIDALEEKDVVVNNRKTLYDDFKYLSESGYEIEYVDGKYYLSDAPFSISEVKIIIDSINSLKNLDDSFLKKLKEKIYSFISVYEADYLKQLEYHNRHTDKRFINRLEDSLLAIRQNKFILMKRNGHDEEKIHPLFIYRQNDYYYLYYHYYDSEKIYHVRFDNIDRITLTEDICEKRMDRNTIISHINESSSAFYSDKSSLITFIICEDSDYLRSRLEDDFPNIIYTKKGFSIKASVNQALFSKLVGYGTSIKIDDKDIAQRYKEYLSDIIHNN